MIIALSIQRSFCSDECTADTLQFWSVPLLNLDRVRTVTISCVCVCVCVSLCVCVTCQTCTLCPRSDCKSSLCNGGKKKNPVPGILCSTCSWQPVIDSIESKYEEFLNAESRVNRKISPDNRVHCCLYFISPNGHGYVTSPHI